MTVYWTYIIKCPEGRFYIGLSANPDKRLDAHNNGLSKWTSRFKNWKIVYLKKFDSYKEAREWELYLKKQKGGVGFRSIMRSAGS